MTAHSVPAIALSFLDDSFIHLKFMSSLVGYCNLLFTEETIKGPVMKAVMMSRDLYLSSVDPSLPSTPLG